MTGEDGRTTGERRWLTILGIAIAVAAVLFLAFPEIDLVISRLFTDESGRFWLARHPVPRLFNELINKLGLALGIFLGAGLLYTLVRRRPFAGYSARAYVFLVSCLVVAPGLMANALFKSHWGRARPRQLVEFGGTAEFTPALLIADQCEKNCSFVAGDPSLAFMLIAFALLAPAARSTWVGLAVLFGAVIGYFRIIQGAHFLSDVVFSGLFVAVIVLVLKIVIIDRRGRIAATLDRLGDAVSRGASSAR